MCTKSALVCLGLLWVLPALITADDCAARDPLVGVGYNIVFGNPDGESDLAGRDPGIKYNYRILDITYDEGESVTIRGNEYCVPDQVSTVPLTSCSYEEDTYLFSGTASYQEAFSSQVEVDAKYDNGLSSYKFSGSNEYESVEKASESTESVFFDKRAFCHESQSRYRIENIPYADEYGVSESFYNAFVSLPDVSSSAITEDEKEEYYTFLTTWGTHIIEEHDLGGRRTQRYQSSLTDLYEYALETSSTSISLGGEYNGFSTSVSLDIDTLSESTSSSSSFGESYKEISTGSEIEFSDEETRWYIPDDDTSTPEPTQLYLVSIATVCDYDGYWSTISEVTSVSDLTQNRCTNLEKAIANYSEYLELSESSDAFTLPITWPEGVYGLLKPTDGCPDDTNGFSFATGWRSQRAKKKKKHSYSDGNHFEGSQGKNRVRYEFCMKNTESGNSGYEQSWPAGEYCIYKSPEGDCPEDFNEGYIYWDDRKKGERSNANLPEGKYKSGSTTLYYCCRFDGSTSEEIYLPTSDPFYLMQRGDNCQEVSGMSVSTEQMKIASKKTKNSGYVPYFEGGSRITMNYCYYS